jgi:hypothetical protein
MMASRALMAGEALGVYRELCRAPQTAEALCRKLGTNASGLLKLLEALSALKVLRRRRGGLWEVRARVKKWVDPTSPLSVCNFLRFNRIQWDWWTHLERSVKDGPRVGLHQKSQEDAAWGEYAGAMFDLARLSAGEVARKLPLPRRPQALLDIGGSHGAFALAVCQRHPGMRAVVLDLPPAARAGRALLAQMPQAHLVRHREGDALTHGLEGPYDGALCFQLFHHLSPPQIQMLSAKIFAALKPGGTIAILEYLKPRSPSQASGLLGLHYFLTSEAETYSLSEISGWLREAGFEKPKARPIRRLPLQTLVTARKAR